MSNPSGTPDPYSTAPSVGGAPAQSPVGSYQGTAYPPVSGTGVPTGSGDLSTGSTDSPSTADVAKSEAAGVKDTAVDAGKNVVETAKSEAAQVATEAKQQARSLLETASSELRSQGSNQQQRAAGALRALAKELGGMASASPESGPLTDLAHEASRKGGEIAYWLENHEPSDLVRELGSFARRRPGLFLALCAGAGVVAGRLTRGAVAANTSLDSKEPDTSTSPALSAGYASAPTDYQAPAGYGSTTGGYAAGAAPTYGTTAGSAPYGGVETDPYQAGGAPSGGWTDNR